MVDVHTESYVSVWLGIALFVLVSCRIERLRTCELLIEVPCTF